MKSVFLGGIGVRLMVSERLMIGYLLHYAGYSVLIFGKKKNKITIIKKTCSTARLGKGERNL